MIGWKSDTFEKLQHFEIRYDDMFVRYKIDDAQQLKRDKVGLIVLLKHKASGKQFIIVNSHLEHSEVKDYVKFA